MLPCASFFLLQVLVSCTKQNAAIQRKLESYTNFHELASTFDTSFLHVCHGYYHRTFSNEGDADAV